MISNEKLGYLGILIHSVFLRIPQIELDPMLSIRRNRKIVPCLPNNTNFTEVKEMTIAGNIKIINKKNRILNRVVSNGIRKILVA